MRITVIGGSGHIGTWLVPMLAQEGYEVICVSRGIREPYQAHAAWQEIRPVHLDRAACEAAGNFGNSIAALDAECVIDLTCFTPASAAHLVEALRGRVGHFLHCGTIWVHGHSVEIPTTEEAPRAPFGNYGIRKLAIETYLMEQASTGFPATVLHPGHIVGPGWTPINPAGNLNLDVFQRLLAGLEVILPNQGMETLHHVHAADVAVAFAQAVKRREDAVGHSFHVVSPAALTMREYAERIAWWAGREPILAFLPWEEWRARHSETDARITWDHLAHSPNCSIGKARELLGYQPRYSSLEAVEEALEWLIANGRLRKEE